MLLLIHGNGRPDKKGRVSPQLVDRVTRAVAAYEASQDGPDPISKVCFFAGDHYPDGTSAKEYVQDRFTGLNQLLIDDTAYSTVDEVRAFARVVRSSTEFPSVCVSTSWYHVMRSRILLWRSLVFPSFWIQSPLGDPADVLLEPAKLAKDLCMFPIHERSAHGTR